MKISLFVLAALVGTTLLMPMSSAAIGTPDESTCPPTTVERVMCILEPYVGPVRDLVLDETSYQLQKAVTLVVQECRHLTGSCPIIIRGEEGQVPFDILG